MNKRRNGLGLGAALFFIVAALSLIVGLLLAVRGRGVSTVFLGAAMIFFVVGIAATRKNRGLGDSDGEPHA